MFKFDHIKISGNPYQHFVIEDSLDIDFFRSLQEEIREIFNRSAENKNIETIPSNRHHKSSPPGLLMHIGGAGYSDGLAVDIILTTAKKGGSLEKLTHYLSLQETQEKLYHLLIPRTLRKPFSLRPLKIHAPDSKIGLLEHLIYRNCYVSIKLSAYENNAGLFQHVDHAEKVIALLLYIGHSDGIDRKSGGTQVYEVAKGEQRWSDKHFPYLDYVEETKLILKNDVSPLPNRLFGFKPSRISWHGVAPTILPKGVRRECLQINLMKSRNFSGNIIPWIFKLKEKVRLRSRIKKFFNA